MISDTDKYWSATAKAAKTDVSTTMIYTHVLDKGGRGVRGPLDGP